MISRITIAEAWKIWSSVAVSLVTAKYAQRRSSIALLTSSLDIWLVKFVSSEICLAVCFARGSPFWAPAGLS